MSKSILIVSYIFPPFPSVGGRRWLKFAKYLSQDGFDVHVIHARNPLSHSSPWTHELTTTPHMTLHPISARYTKVLFTTPAFFHQKIAYKIAAKLLSVFFKGHTYDWSLLWKSAYLKKARELIHQKNISVVITSGAPFHSLHHSLELKKYFPEIKIVSDFRDPWVENLELQGIPAERLEHERQLEKEVLNTSDLVITVSETMTQRLRLKTAEDRRHNIQTIHNGFDPLDINFENFTESSKVKLIYAGELYGGIKHLVDPFLETLQFIQQNNPELFSELDIKFYGHIREPYHLKGIKCYPSLSRKELNQKINQMTAGIVFLPDHIDFAFTTKFVEYLGYQKPLLIISKYGSTAKFVEKNKIGHWINPDDFLNSFLRVLNLLKTQKNYYKDFDTVSFSIPNLTNKLIDELQRRNCI